MLAFKVAEGFAARHGNCPFCGLDNTMMLSADAKKMCEDMVKALEHQGLASSTVLDAIQDVSVLLRLVLDQ